MNRIMRTAMCAVFALTVPFMIGLSHAQEVVVDNDTGVGARAMGMGGAQIAAVEDVTAVIHNPAALARIQDLEVQLGLNMMKRQIDTSLKSTTGTGKESSITWVTIAQFSRLERASS